MNGGRDAGGTADRGRGEVREFTESMLADGPAERRIDFERGMAYAAPATLAIVVACCAAFGWQIATGGLDSPEALERSGALVTRRLLDGEAWRLVSSMFLHGGGDHLIGNMLALFILGIACEHAYGPRLMLAIYGAAGIIGGIVSAAVMPLPTVGASGAIFGLMGCVVAMLARRRRELHVRDGRIGVVVAVWAVWQLAAGFLAPGVANMAHLGGLLAGAALGWSLVPRMLSDAGPVTGSGDNEPNLPG